MPQRPRGHIVNRGNGRWRLIAEGPRDPDTGKRRQMSRVVQAKGQKEAQDMLAAFIREIGTGAVASGTRARTVAELLERWYANVRGQVEPNTARSWRYILDSYLLPSDLAGMKLAKVTAADLDTLYRRLETSGSRTGKKLSAATVRKVHVVCRLAFGQAVAWTWLATNPALTAKPPKVVKGEDATPDTDAAKKLIAAAWKNDEQWGLFLRLCATLGARRGEVCGLRYDSVDLTAGTVTIRWTVKEGADGLVVAPRAKTESSLRTVRVDARTVQLLEKHLRWQKERALKFGVHPAANGFVFSDAADCSRPWHPHVVTTRFRRLRVALKMGDVKLHSLRHYAATQMLADGLDARTVAGRLGHANPHETLNRYARFLPARDQAAADLLARLLDEEAG